jgi:hypothetical protein
VSSPSAHSFVIDTAAPVTSSGQSRQELGTMPGLARAGMLEMMAQLVKQGRGELGSSGTPQDCEIIRRLGGKGDRRTGAGDHGHRHHRKDPSHP